MNWKSEEIEVDGMSVHVKADADGVEFGKTVDGVYASDLLISDTGKARAIASALLNGADVTDAAREG